MLRGDLYIYYPVIWLERVRNLQNPPIIVPYFSIDNAHLMYNAQPKFFDISFDV
jgi:hypothetical protein